MVTLSKEEIKPIISLCRNEQYQPGEAIFHQGDQGNKIYIIKEGQVSIERSVDLGDRKAQLNIAILGPGRALGSWLALLANLIASCIQLYAPEKQRSLLSMALL